MNPFEKIFNYQVISRLEESGTIPFTSHERAWLKRMLAHPAASEALTPATLQKLNDLLAPDETMELSGIFVEKAKSAERQVYHPLLRTLGRILSAQQGIRLTYTNNHRSHRANRSGIPYKLEYSLVKKEWYLLWYNLRNRTLKATRLSHIRSVQEETLMDREYKDAFITIEAILESRKEQAVLEVIPLYNGELSRILYAFSCFDKEVTYNEERDAYRITLSFLMDDREYILSKIRFLGKRMKVVEGKVLQQRMWETSAKALARYGITSEE
ncbi:WYL domain-containing protein [Brevibacillus centrosporus]|uniref:WYL domain-containing protein n=1 Tax=Brevibacillus centrosporus TaxID=54910 RepID=UPI002E22F5C1|nr:WYL domain-containing protein [Brevibacillus centrosporus]